MGTIMVKPSPAHARGSYDYKNTGRHGGLLNFGGGTIGAAHRGVNRKWQRKVAAPAGVSLRRLRACDGRGNIRKFAVGKTRRLADLSESTA